MDLEEQYAIGIGVLSVILLVAGLGLGVYFRTAPARVVRVVFPLAALVSAVLYATFVWIARIHVKG